MKWTDTELAKEKNFGQERNLLQDRKEDGHYN
jgi:hypothetical protein